MEEPSAPPQEITLNVTPGDLQNILAGLDSLVKQGGLQAAEVILPLAGKLSEQAKAPN